MESAADTAWTGYSLAERDRRWQAVRTRAAEAGLDCIFVPMGNLFDARYLTDMANASFVLPTDGRTPIAVTDRGHSSAWLPEVRPSGNRTYGPAMADALIEAGMERARIGVTGLRGGLLAHVRAPEGVLLHGPYTEVVQRLPDATFEDATDIVGAVRFVKSQEEIECLRRATAIAEAGIEEMIELARPGMDAAVLYGRVSGRLLELGSEHYRHGLALTLKAPDAEEDIRFTEPPLRWRLQPGTLITNEVSALWGGLVAQEDQPIYLGAMPEEWKPVIETQRGVWEAGLEAMKPGTTFGELIDFVNGFGAQSGMTTRITMHGRGNSDDGPLLTSRNAGEQVRRMQLAEGNAFVWKPSATTSDGHVHFGWGGDVVVTAHGGERLFKRPHGLVCVSDRAGSRRHSSRSRRS